MCWFDAEEKLGVGERVGCGRPGGAVDQVEEGLEVHPGREAKWGGRAGSVHSVQDESQNDRFTLALRSSVKVDQLKNKVNSAFTS